MKRLLFAASLLLATLPAFSQYRTETVRLDVNGLERRYQVYLPGNYSENQHYPVVFILHGGGGTARGMVRFTKARFNELADRDGFIAVYPNGYKKGWNDGERDTLSVSRRLNIDDVGFFDAMIDDLSAKLSVDRQNIFACGISNGGFMVQRLAIERAYKFKAVAAVAAGMSPDQVAKPKPQKPVSVMFLCGTADPLVPYNGGPVMVLKQKRGEVLSVQESVDYWKTVNGCTQKIRTKDFKDINKYDHCTAHETVWQNHDHPNIKVADICIENGGHTWPGGKQYLPRKLVGNVNRDFDACDEIWEFFKAQLSLQNLQ